MAVQTTLVNKPLNPRGNDQSPLAYNRAKLFSGKALSFDGVNDTLSTDYAPSSNIQTTAYWVKLDSLTTNYVLGGFVSSSDQFGLYYWGGNANKNFGFNTWNADSYGVTLPDFADDYFHVVAEYNFTDFTQSKIFVNGQELSISQTHGTTLQRTTASRTFKFDSPNSNQEVNAQISGVKVFEGSLTAAQVADLYNNPEKVVPTGVDNTALKLWLPMQEGAGTTAYDGSGNGNHGTISGATYVHGIGAPVSQTAVIDWNKGVNKITYSEDFSQSVWSKTQVNIESGYTAPDGSATAYKVTYDDTAANLFGFTNQALGTYKSIWAKTTSGTGTTSLMNRYNEPSSVFTITNEWQRFDVAHSGGDFFYAVDMRGGGLTEVILWGAQMIDGSTLTPYIPTHGTAQTSDVLLPQGLTSGRDITGVNLFENVRKQGALNLDGNSWAEVHDNGSLDFGTGSFSLEAWVKVKFAGQGSSVNVILNLGNEINSSDSAGLAMSNVLAANFWYSSPSGSSVLTEGDWVHIIGVYDETNATLYVDGLQVDQDARNAKNVNNALVKRIGRDSNTNRYYHDQIAQPRIYNRALTAEEVQRNYNAGKNIYTN